MKILYSQSCRLAKNWTEVIQDEEFVSSVKTFLSVIQKSYQKCEGFPRLLIPQQFTLSKIICHSDGATIAASWTMFMVSYQDNNGPKAFCVNADAGSKIRSHSVPCNEASGLLQGCRAVTAFIASQYVNFSSRCTGLLQVHYQVDSACLGSWLSPHVLHKQVLIRNMCTAVHNLCSDLSQDFPLQFPSPM